jgi:hypothetical protein
MGLNVPDSYALSCLSKDFETKGGVQGLDEEGALQKAVFGISIKEG